MDTAEADRAAITFGTDGWRARLSEFSTARVRMVAQGVASYLDAEHRSGPVAIGYDARATSREFAEELARVLCANGRDVIIPPRDCPTPVLAWTVASGAYAGGLMVTASHNPPEYNGIKFIPADGSPALPGVTAVIEDHLEPPRSGNGPDHGRVNERDILEPYLTDALETVDTSLAGLTVAYDAMHGSGRGVTDTLLERAGATVLRFRCERDPDFGGGAPEPVPERTTDLVECVTGGSASLGLVNDGDADRLGVVTPERGFLDPNLVLALLYSILLEDETGDVVRTVSTSSLIDRIADAAGQAVHETPVGFKWVAGAMADHDVLVGGEESGGYGLPDHLPNKDGVHLALLVAAAHHDRRLDDRIDSIQDTHGRVFQDRTSIDCPDSAKEATMTAIETGAPEDIAGVSVAGVSTVDGLKLTMADGTWLLLRPSGTEPKLRLYAEATEQERVETLLSAGTELVEAHIE